MNKDRQKDAMVHWNCRQSMLTVITSYSIHYTKLYEMSIRRITAFKAQHRWLMRHLHIAISLGFEQIPVRTTLSRRYKMLYPILQAFIAFVGRWAESLHLRFDSRVV